MSKDWLETLEGHLPRSVARLVKDADKPLHDFALHAHLSHWHPISTAPCNQELELRVTDNGKSLTLEFPCLQTNTDGWIDVDLGTQISVQPIEWRVWQRNKSVEHHHSKVHVGDRSALFHRGVTIVPDRE